jgi:GcrA cell cycle regulator
MNPTAKGANGGGWTDDRVAALKKLWAEGLSCSQVAKRLGGVTRNGVIGKVTRLGLPMRGRVAGAEASRINGKHVSAQRLSASRSASGMAHRVKMREDAPPTASAKPVPAPETADPGQTAHKTLMDRPRGVCEWPLNLVSADGEILYCCGPRDLAHPLPYCDKHLRLRVAKVRTPEQLAGDRARADKLQAKALRRYT